MKFLHAADIHLDSSMAGVARRDPALAEVTRDCTRRAFSNLIDRAIAEDVAFVLIAGDLYDGTQRDYRAGLFFAAEMRRLGRPCVLIHGNHDAPSPISRSLQPPPNVHVLPTRAPDVVQLHDHRVAVHGQSFPNRAVPEDLAAGYRDPLPGWFNIGLLHTSVEDPAGEHDTYAPCRLETLVNKGYDYWALGHVHTRATLHDKRPWVHFPGNPQGRHVRETGSRGATLVEVRDGHATLTHLPTDVLRWASLRVDAAGIEHMAELVTRLRFLLTALWQDAGGLPVIARISLHGATPLHAALVADPAALDAECRNAAAAVDSNLHIERVLLETSPGMCGGAELDPLHEAFRAAFAEPGLVETLLKDFERLAGAIPVGASPGLPRTSEALRALEEDAWYLAYHALLEGSVL